MQNMKNHKFHRVIITLERMLSFCRREMEDESEAGIRRCVGVCSWVSGSGEKSLLHWLGCHSCSPVERRHLVFKQSTANCQRPTLKRHHHSLILSRRENPTAGDTDDMGNIPVEKWRPLLIAPDGPEGESSGRGSEKHCSRLAGRETLRQLPGQLQKRTLCHRYPQGSVGHWRIGLRLNTHCPLHQLYWCLRWHCH